MGRFIIYLEFKKQQQNNIRYGYSTLTTLYMFLHLGIQIWNDQWRLSFPEGSSGYRNRTTFLHLLRQLSLKLIKYATAMCMNFLFLEKATLLLMIICMATISYHIHNLLLTLPEDMSLPPVFSRVRCCSIFSSWCSVV